MSSVWNYAVTSALLGVRGERGGVARDGRGTPSQRDGFPVPAVKTEDSRLVSEITDAQVASMVLQNYHSLEL